MRSRGLTIIETIFGIAILALIILVVGDAISHTMRTGSLAVGRANESRSVTTLEARLNEEARSATSVFVPPFDVLGQDNSTVSAHEVDFYRRLANGSDAYVAYLFNRGAGTVSRYDYTLVGKNPQPSDADIAADGIAAFSPRAVAVGDTGDVVDGQSVAPVSVYYGSQRNAGGNGVVLVNIVTAAAPGAAAESATIHLAAKSAPTDLAELVSDSSPPPKGPVVVTFMILPKPAKGPWHGGGGGDGEPGGIHGPSIPGMATFLGQGDSNVNWLDVHNAEPVLESGLYRYTDSNGNRIRLTVSCDNGNCPQFVPLPQNIPGAPKGVVVFRTSQ